jgi:hypothetical protein
LFSAECCETDSELAGSMKTDDLSLSCSSETIYYGFANVSGLRGGVVEVQLGGVRWYLLADVSGQPVGPISKFQSSTSRITA